MPRVIIRHPKDGREYGIDSADFKRRKLTENPETGEPMTLEAAGFEIVSMADGSPYEPPASRGERAPS